MTDEWKSADFAMIIRLPDEFLKVYVNSLGDA